MPIHPSKQSAAASHQKYYLYPEPPTPPAVPAAKCMLTCSRVFLSVNNTWPTTSSFLSSHLLDTTFCLCLFVCLFQPFLQNRSNYSIAKLPHLIGKLSSARWQFTSHSYTAITDLLPQMISLWRATATQQ